MKREGWLCWSSVRLDVGYAFGWPGLLGAMVWQGRASLKPCSGKVCSHSFPGALVHLEALSTDQLMKREGWLSWSSVRLAVGFASGRPWLLGAMVWLGRASLKPCSGKLCFGRFRAALVHVEALSTDQLMKREGWLCWGSVPLAAGFASGWPWLLGAMVWLGRASLKPCSGKLCFGRFGAALVHVEALSTDQLMKREGWLCWSSVRLAVGFASGRPWLLGAMVWLGRASLKPCSGKLCFGRFRAALVHVEALSTDQLMKREGWLCWSSVRLAVGFASGWPWLLGALVWLGRASLKPCSGKLCFGRFRAALVHVEALSTDQLMKREGWLCWSSVRLAVGFASGWPWLLGALVWLGRASLKPCSGKLCFHSFPGALVHVEALSTDQLMKREGWLCWSSVRLAVGYAFGWPGLLGAMVWLGRASLKPCSGKLCFGRFRTALVHVEALSTDQFLGGVERLCWGSVRLDVGYAFGRPGFHGAMVWLGRASLKPCSGKLCFHSFPGALVHVEALSTDQFLRGVERLCWGSVRLDVGYAFGWPGFLGAMVWLGRASLKPCSGKLCFGRFRAALVHVEALSTDQLMKREGWLCWSSVRLDVGYAFGWPGLLGGYGLAGPGFLETMLWQSLFS